MFENVYVIIEEFLVFIFLLKFVEIGVNFLFVLCKIMWFGLRLLGYSYLVKFIVS